MPAKPKTTGIPAFAIKADRLIADGKAVPFKATPNHGGILSARYLIMHFTAGRNAETSIDWFMNPEARASAHLVIGRDGSITQMASFNVTAWHAGKSHWGNIDGLNSHSIGIELDNAGRLEKSAGGGWKAWFGGNYPDSEVILAKHKNETEVAGWHAYTEIQLEVAVAVGAAIARHYDLADVLGHDDIAPHRKNDPGPAFPMNVFKARVMGRDDSEVDAVYFVSEVLNLRDGPSSVAAKVIPDGLPPGTSVKPTGQTEGTWWKVEVIPTMAGNPDLEGWVNSRFLSSTAPHRSLSRGPAGYQPPAFSASVLEGIRFEQATPVGAVYRQLWAAMDVNNSDPNNCKALLRFPDNTLFFETKLSIDADGSPRATKIDPSGQLQTSLRYTSAGVHKGKSMDAEHVPYFVLPLPDKSGDNDISKDFGIQLGDLAMIVHKGGMSPAIFADLGPHRKIGEASIRVHELLPVRSPWRNPVTKDTLRNASVEGGVLTFVFPGTHGILASLTPANAEALITEKAMEFFQQLKS